MDDMFERAFSERTAAWHLRPTREWTLVATDPEGDPLADYQETMIEDRKRRRGSHIG